MELNDFGLKIGSNREHEVLIDHPSEKAKKVTPERLGKNQFSVIISGFSGNELVREELEKRGYGVMLIPDSRDNMSLYIENDPRRGVPFNWIRDAFFETREDLFVVSNRVGLITDFLTNQGIPFRRNKVVESPLGEQGRVVADGNTILLSTVLIAHPPMFRD